MLGRMPFQRLRPALPIDYVLMIGVAYLAYGRHARDQHPAGFAGRQLQQRIVAFLGHQLRRSTGRAYHLRALARAKLDVVHRGAGGNVLERQRIADQNVGFRPVITVWPSFNPPAG